MRKHGVKDIAASLAPRRSQESQDFEVVAVMEGVVGHKTYSIGSWPSTSSAPVPWSSNVSARRFMLGTIARPSICRPLVVSALSSCSGTSIRPIASAPVTRPLQDVMKPSRRWSSQADVNETARPSRTRVFRFSLIAAPFNGPGSYSWQPTTSASPISNPSPRSEGEKNNPRRNRREWLAAPLDVSVLDMAEGAGALVESGHGAGWEGWVMLMFMIVFVVAIVVAIVLLVRYLGQQSGGAPAAAASSPALVNAPESPKDILKRRYAAGEIEREEYLQKLGDL